MLRTLSAALKFFLAFSTKYIHLGPEIEIFSTLALLFDESNKKSALGPETKQN
jgi:hypothetical protein